MAPIGWGLAMVVWGYALVWALVTDRVKLLAYRILDPATAKASTDAAPPRATAPADATAPSAKASTAVDSAT
jgi:H+-transporting ATPase